jgi:hypothetical protein
MFNNDISSVHAISSVNCVEMRVLQGYSFQTKKFQFKNQLKELFPGFFRIGFSP